MIPNSGLPAVGGPLAVASWLTPFSASLTSQIADRDGLEQRVDLVGVRSPPELRVKFAVAAPAELSGGGSDVAWVMQRLAKRWTFRPGLEQPWPRPDRAASRFLAQAKRRRPLPAPINEDNGYSTRPTPLVLRRPHPRLARRLILDPCTTAAFPRSAELYAHGDDAAARHRLSSCAPGRIVFPRVSLFEEGGLLAPPTMRKGTSFSLL